MDIKLKEILKEALIRLNQENEKLIQESNYSQVSENACTISKIAETLSMEQATNIRKE